MKAKILLLCICGASIAAQAAQVVDFEPGLVMVENRELPAVPDENTPGHGANDPAPGASTGTLFYATDTPMLTGDGTNNTIYGGITYSEESRSNKNVNISNEDVFRFSPTNSVRLGVRVKNNAALDVANTRFTAAMIWDSEDFVGHEAGNVYQYGTPEDGFTDSMLELWYSFGSGNDNGEESSLRFIIRDGSDYYISTVHGGKDGLLWEANRRAQANNLTQSNLKWAQFDVANILDFDAYGSTGNATTYNLRTNDLVFVDRGFYDVTGVGFVVHASRAANPLEGARFDLNDFHAFLHVVNTAYTYSDWADEYLPDVIGAETNDFDDDGFDNLYEFALNGDPTGGTDGGGEAPVFTVVDNGFEYTHLVRNNAPGLTYKVQTRESLTSGIWLDTGFQIEGTNVTGTIFDEVTNSIPVVVDQTFVRLKIEEGE